MPRSPPGDGTEFNGVRLGGDSLGQRPGLVTVKKTHPFHVLGGRIGAGSGGH